LAVEALESVKADKLEKACNIIREYLQLNLSAD
jgi:hypothetical protein